MVFLEEILVQESHQQAHLIKRGSETGKEAGLRLDIILGSSAESVGGLRLGEVA